MVEHRFEAVPESHRRARDLVRKRLAAFVSDDSPTWTVELDGKSAVAVAGAERLVLASTGMTGIQLTLPYPTIRALDRAGTVLAVTDRTGWTYRLQFDNEADAATADTRLRGSGASNETGAKTSPLDSILIVTTNDVPGYDIIAVHGDVFGLVVRARDMFSNMGASLRTIVGGEVGGYTKLLTESRNDARDRMAREAIARGGKRRRSHAVRLQRHRRYHERSGCLRHRRHHPPTGSSGSCGRRGDLMTFGRPRAVR